MKNRLKLGHKNITRLKSEIVTGRMSAWVTEKERKKKERKKAWV